MIEGQYPLSITKSFTAWMIALRLRFVSSTCSTTGDPPIFLHDDQFLLCVVNVEYCSVNPPSVLEFPPAPQFQVAVGPPRPSDRRRRFAEFLHVRGSTAHRGGLDPDGAGFIDSQNVDDAVEILPHAGVGVPSLNYLGEVAVSSQPLQRPCCG